MILSPLQVEALRNLSRKKTGATVGWMAIAPARELTALGLAVRSRCGWQITSAGEAALNGQADVVRSSVPTPPLPFPQRAPVSHQ